MEVITSKFVSPLDMKSQRWPTSRQLANERNISHMRRRIVNGLFPVGRGVNPHGYAVSWTQI